MRFGHIRFFSNYINNKKNKLNKFYKITGSRFLIKTNFSHFETYIHIFYLWNFIILKNNNTVSNFLIFLFSPSYYFNFIFSPHFLNFYYNKFTQVLYFQFYYIFNFYRLSWKILKLIYGNFFFFYLKKLKFRGKGYYIFKNNRNTITFRFGYSHRIYLYFFKLKVKFLSKTSILIIGLNKNDLIFSSFKLKKVRPYNLFTGKGIRFNKQIIYKKTGKASSYM